VYQRTASAALTAVTYALTFLPDLIAGPLLSGLADRIPRRDVLAGCALIQAVLVGIMAIRGPPRSLVATIVVLSAAPLAARRAPRTGGGCRYLRTRAGARWSS